MTNSVNNDNSQNYFNYIHKLGEDERDIYPMPAKKTRLGEDGAGTDQRAAKEIRPIKDEVSIYPIPAEEIHQATGAGEIYPIPKCPEELTPPPGQGPEKPIFPDRNSLADIATRSPKQARFLQNFKNRI